MARADYISSSYRIIAVGLYIICADGLAPGISVVEKAQFSAIPVFCLLDRAGVSGLVRRIFDCAGAGAQVPADLLAACPITGIMAIPIYADGARPARIGALRLFSERPYGTHHLGVVEHPPVGESTLVLALFCLHSFH